MLALRRRIARLRGPRHLRDSRRRQEALAWALRLTAAAVAAYVAARGLFPGGPPPLLAPLTALLVVQLTPVSLLTSGLDRVISVVAGVLVAVGFSTVVPLSWWSLGLVIAVSLTIGQVLRLGSNLLEVPISAMLVLGVGQFQAEAAAWQRVTETLVGAGVGVASNLLFPPKVAARDAGDAIRDLAERLADVLRHAADEIRDLAGDSQELAARSGDWLDEVRRTTHAIPPVGEALLRAEESRRLNLRAVGRPDAGPGLRQGLEALEHSAIAVRGLVRAVHDAVADPGWPAGDVGMAVATVVEHVFRDLADALASFGGLVRAEAGPGGGDPADEAARSTATLEALGEARARTHDLLVADGPPVLAELQLALATTVRRLLRELDLGERDLRRSALQRPARLTRRIRRPSRALGDRTGP